MDDHADSLLEDALKDLDREGRAVHAVETDASFKESPELLEQKELEEMRIHLKRIQQKYRGQDRANFDSL